MHKYDLPVEQRDSTAAVLNMTFTIWEVSLVRNSVRKRMYQRDQKGQKHTTL
jgi:hypothetical protein